MWEVKGFVHAWEIIIRRPRVHTINQCQCKVRNFNMLPCVRERQKVVLTLSAGLDRMGCRGIQGRPAKAERQVSCELG